MTVLFHDAIPRAAGFRDVYGDKVAAARSKVRIIDVREPQEFVGELGHITGAELVPLGTITEAAARWDKESELVLVCRSGGRSSTAAGRLAAMGFCRCMNMVGGMLAYSAAGHPIER